jgi:hypothetical protein
MHAKGNAGFIIGLLFFFVVSAWTGTAALAGVDPVPWMPASGGFDNPLFWVMFNPQPEPPGDWMTYTMNSQGEVVFTTQYGADGLGMMFGASSLTGLLDKISLSLTPDGFTYLLSSGTQPPMYQADFTFQVNGMGLFPGSAVMFNPQPEPPGAPDVRIFMEFLLLDATGSAVVGKDTEVNMTMRLTDASGNLISLMPAPIAEPATALLISSGLIGLMAGRRMFRR